VTGELKTLDLFSGIGGFSLGLERAGPFRTVAFCEQDAWCQAVLRKHWPDVPIYDDVRTIDFEGDIDVITGGYPCQPFSVAGKQKGAADDRHLWPSMFEIIKHKRPRWVVAENVAGHIAMGLDEVLFDLESEGYTARPVVIPACAVDAPHRRDRVWIIAAKDGTNADSKRSHRTDINQQRESKPADGEERIAGQVRAVLAGRGDAGKRQTENVANADDTGPQRNIRKGAGTKGKVSEGSEQFQPRSGTMCGREYVADADDARLQGREQRRTSGEGEGASRPTTQRSEDGGPLKWIAQPGVGGMADGVPRWLDEPDCGRVATGVKNRVARLKALGNAIVPQVVAQIGRAILAAEKQ